jgi:hypothetical protein
MPKILMVFGTFFVVSACLAQEPTPGTESATQPQAADEQSERVGGRPLLDDVFGGLHNRWGFALSAYQAYTDNVSSSGETNLGSGITAFIPRTFFNFGRRRSRLHLDLSAGYRMYNQHREMNSWDYFGNASYSYELSRRTNLAISNQFTSSYNDSWSFVSFNSPINYDAISSNEVMFNRQRITRNAVSAILGRRFGRKARVELIGQHHLYRYSDGSLDNTQAVGGGGTFDYQLTRWLDFSSRYTYLHHLDERYPDTQIQRFEVGGFHFNLTRAWQIWGGGGVDIGNREGESMIGTGVAEVSEDINAGTSYATDKSSVSLTYQRGFTSGIGISRLLVSDVYSADFNHRFSRRISANIEAYYYRSREVNAENGLLETLSVGGGFQFALLPSLIVSTSGSYQKQQTDRFSVQGLNLNRFSIYVGLQYVWPSLRRAGVTP